mgnify:CR=1 FL=1
MKRLFIPALLLAMLLASLWTTASALPAQQALSRIASPGENSVVRGIVPIVGSAIDAQFWKYEVHYAPYPNPLQQWTGIGGVHESSVADGLLETWDTTIVPDGSYSIRLRVVDRTGNYREFFANGVLVANAAPTETPVPTRTPEPTATGTPAATPTFMLPTAPLTQPSPTPTLARPTRSALPDVVDPTAWRQSVCLGTQLMGAFLVVLGLVFLLRRLF